MDLDKNHRISPKVFEKFRRDLIKLSHIDGVDIGAAINKNRAAISNYRAGRKWPGPTTVAKLDLAFGPLLASLGPDKTPPPDESEHRIELDGQTAKEFYEAYKADPASFLMRYDQRMQRIDNNILTILEKIEALTPVDNKQQHEGETEQKEEKGTDL